MIYFEERTVKKIQKNRLEQELKNKKSEEILLIYNNDSYMGCLGWEKEVWNKPENIVTEYIDNEEDAKEICERLLAEKPFIKIPIFISQSELGKIIFAGKANMTEDENTLLTAIKSLKQTNNTHLCRCLSLYKGILLPDTGVIFNQLEELFVKYGLNVLRTKTEVVDEKWLVLEEGKNEYRKISQSIIKEAGMENIYKYFRIKSQLKEIGIPVIFIAFPCISDLELTIEEKYRVEHRVTFRKEILKSGTISEKIELARVYQKQISEEDINRARLMKLSQGEKNTLYLCGPCLVEGNAPEGDRFPEVLYKEIVSKFGYKIEKIVISEVDSITPNQISGKEFSQNDFLIIVRHMSKDLRERFKSCIDIDLTDFYQHRSGEISWFADDPVHITGEGSHQLVKYLYPMLTPYLLQKKSNKSSIEEYKQITKLELNHTEKKELEIYFSKIKQECFEREFSEKNKIGAIVMNCNPFTNGHKYLIKQASKEVDGLYVFVVEEDLSIFPFADRIKMVKDGIEGDCKSVQVIPSGRFVLSNRTFASYFAKETLQTKVIDVSEDVAFFGQFIAPRLHIDIRFFGEEPVDAVTRQYNENMKRKLPYYGVRVKEIPRIGLAAGEGNIISASKVRAAWKENQWDLIKKMVPLSTLQYLQSQDKEMLFRRERKLQCEKSIPEKRRKQLRQIRRLIKEKGMTILYGTGWDAKGIVGLLEEKERRKLLFCDKKAEKGEFYFEGIPVIAPEMLFRKYRNQGIYITTTEYAEEIFEELMDGGITYNNIFCNPYPWFEIDTVY